MATDFQEFLQKKAGEFNLPERREQRSEWLDALSRLYSDLVGWLREADPQGLLVMSDFELDRIEPALGRYLAPALKISLGEASAQVIPIGRFSIGYARLDPGDHSRIAGRVDITDGSRKSIAYRVIDAEGGRESWIVPDDRGRPEPLDRAKLEAILQELWS